MIEAGYCQCGCGAKTPIAKFTRYPIGKGVIKGLPTRYIRGHANRKPFDAAVSFWPRVSKSDSCWEWTGCKDKKGYGHIRINAEHMSAHRLSWVLHNDGLGKWEGHHDVCVLHKCDNPSCVNPDHLFLGTHKDNMEDRAAKKRGADFRGEKSKRAKLTWAEVKAIRLDNRAAPAVAKDYGVSNTTIKDIRRNRIWKLEWTPNSLGEADA